MPMGTAMDKIYGYYNRKGERIGLPEFTKLFNNKKYKIVKHTELANGKFVSTVWLGLDYSFSGNPLIFETMVFPKRGEFSELDVERYSTEKEAIKGHEEMCKKWRD